MAVIYRTLDDISKDLFEAMRDMPEDGSAGEWLANNDGVVRLSILARVYFKALHNPPDGVIGVGAITYAEKKLCDFQQD